MLMVINIDDYTTQTSSRKERYEASRAVRAVRDAREAAIMEAPEVSRPAFLISICQPPFHTTAAAVGIPPDTQQGREQRLSCP